MTMTFDPKEAERAWQAAQPDFAILPPLKGDFPGVNMEAAAIFALGKARDVAEPALRARFALLPAQLFDQAHLERLALAAWAVWYARQKLSDAQAAAPTRKVSEETATHAAELKTRMVKLIKYVLASNKTVMARLADILLGQGYSDLASDLPRLADIYEENLALVSRDPVNYRAEDVEDARKTAQQLIFELNGNSPEARTWLDNAAKAVRLLELRYREVMAAGRFIERDNRPEEQFPTLLGAIRK